MVNIFILNLYQILNIYFKKTLKLLYIIYKIWEVLKFKYILIIIKFY